MKLLIVDDNDSVRWLLKLVLSDLAEHCYECADGAAALRAYADLRPDWVLMDIRMPVLDGIAATRQILATDGAARILIVTDYDDQHLRAAALNAGARGYLTKDDLPALRQILTGPAESSKLR